jgi:hypothetical protein
MNKIDFKKNILPHLLAVFVFLIVSGLYFLPEWQGYEIKSHDRMSYIGASKEMKDYAEKGEQILWTSRVFSGMPMFQISTSKTLNLVEKVNLLRSFIPFSMNLCFGLMLGLYLALVILRVRVSMAVILAMVFGFSTWFLLSIEAGHSSKVKAISYVAPLVASMVLAYRGKVLAGSLLTAVFLSLMIAANHFQIVFYSIFFVLAVFVVFFVKALKEKDFLPFVKKSFILLAFAILGALPNTALLWPTYDYGKETTRGGKSELTLSDQAESDGLNFDYAMRWSYGKMESFNLLIPGLCAGGYAAGENSKTVEALVARGIPKKQAVDYAKGIPMYYGNQPFTSGPTYLGAVVLFLFLLSFFVSKGNLKWALLSAFILSLFFAWGENFESWNRFFFNNVPMFNKFRAPSMWLTLAIVSTFMGAALTLKSLLEKEYDKKKLLNAVYISSGILATLCVVFWAFGTSLIESFSGSYDAQLQQSGFPIDAIIADRIDLMKSDALRSMFFVLAAAAIVWLWVSEKLKKENMLFAAFGVLLLADFVPVGQRYLNKDDFAPTYGKALSIPVTAADAAILQDKELNFRVFNTTVSSFNDNSTSYHHQSVGGYSAVKLYRYQDLIDYHLSKGNMKVFNMLNTKYFIQGKAGEEKVQVNQGALGSVWFIKNIQWAANADAEMEALNSFNPSVDVVIDERYKSYASSSDFTANGTITLASFHPEKMVYASNAQGEQFAVFSEIWYKGNTDWKAYVDGVETEFVRVNYLLRGLKVPAGSHEIVFEFKPKVFFTGNIISLISSVVILLLIAFVLYRYFTGTKAA